MKKDENLYKDHSIPGRMPKDSLRISLYLPQEVMQRYLLVTVTFQNLLCCHILKRIFKQLRVTEFMSPDIIILPPPHKYSQTI